MKIFFSRGFTLLECLVAVALIGVLAAILIPVIGKTREAALNANDNNGKLMWPWGAYTSNGGQFRDLYWGQVLAEGGYLGEFSAEVPDVLRNPARPVTASSGYAATFALRALNEGKGTRHNPYEDYQQINLSTLEHPPSFFVLTETRGVWADGIIQFASCDRWNPPWLGPNQHALVGFADGSVRSMDKTFFLEDPFIEGSWIREGPGVRDWK